MHGWELVGYSVPTIKSWQPRAPASADGKVELARLATSKPKRDSFGPTVGFLSPEVED